MNWKTDISEGYLTCHICNKLHTAGESTCTRCGDALHQRLPQSIAQTWSYTIAATLFLIAANLVPMMIITTLGEDDGSTIMGGIIYFFEHGEFALGAVILIASFVVPLFKLAVLYFLLLIIHMKQAKMSKLGLKLFHVIHAIGKWSMLDVFVVALMVSMVQFQGLVSIQTGPAAISFCFAVIFTIIASEKFDPRLMFDLNNKRVKT
ncbi:MAG: paraquat-inducible protein A [Lentisphaeraceae bacterium]|nr:paraquat-inducible protein A [Lentisphaeraceae bacterium]